MSQELSRWADPAMFEAAPIEKDGELVTPKVHLLWATPDPLGAIAAACRMYEGKPTYSLSDVNDEERKHYWEQVQKTHLKAPLEFVKLHFFIEGVTRSFTHQMVRQRTAVYAQESLRFAVKDDILGETAVPPSLLNPTRGSELRVWTTAIETIQKVYHMLVNAGIPAEDARGLLPHAITTRLNYATDLRALLDHAGNRLCTQAQFEWRAVFLGIVKAIHDYQGVTNEAVGVDYKSAIYRESDWQFQLIAKSGVFKPVCFQLGHCPFTADFDRQCTIRERVQRGAFEEIKPEEYMADPTAGRRD